MDPHMEIFCFFASPLLRPPPSPQVLALAHGIWRHPPGPGFSLWALAPTSRAQGPWLQSPGPSQSPWALGVGAKVHGLNPGPGG